MKYGKKVGLGCVKDRIPNLEDLSKRSSANIKGLTKKRLLTKRKRGERVHL